ncbi:MAG TPA: FkbM family methyltransferase [Candidatus Omnitrophota bacterium]|nr:FkbM family methyltransferase [Candidatus Omnitrophota bacterium]
MIKEKKLQSFFYNCLLKSCRPVRENDLLSRIVERLWKKFARMDKGPVATKIQGHRVVMNAGYTYPFYAKKYPTLNDPLVELTHQMFKIRKVPIVVVDIGAAIGDTILLLIGKCPDEVGKFYAVEGNDDFFSYLKDNVSCLTNVELFQFFLSAQLGEAKELIHIHAGTASSQGEKKVKTTTLDLLLSQGQIDEKIDLIKIDTDGYDGRILKGATNILRRLKPAVIFEWHPTLCEQTENSYKEHFEVLTSEGYTMFIFFNKFGNFSHFMVNYDEKNIDLLAKVCLRGKFLYDWHYDVIALHGTSGIDPVVLSEMAWAKNAKKSF